MKSNWNETKEKWYKAGWEDKRKYYKITIEAYIEIWKSRLPKEAIQGLKNIIEILSNSYS